MTNATSVDLCESRGRSLVEELGVTISNLTNCLQNLGWIHITPGCRQICLGKAAPSRNKRAIG
ncbi:hypothetical protein H6F52_02645 [Coleofasciculus sp. FACHB-542]|nr:hypothetical protein [Coleofasciculus sp. FACHB-542]